MNDGKYEIERKWLIQGFPSMKSETVSEMEQAYLAFRPVTVRIRKSSSEAGSNYMLCIKSGEGLKRLETEIPLTAQQYSDLCAHLPAPPVRKLYKTYRLPGGYILECNLVDEGEPGSFYYAEVEFSSEEEALAFTPPSWLGQEVTQQEGYSMAAYSRGKFGLDKNGIALETT